MMCAGTAPHGDQFHEAQTPSPTEAVTELTLGGVIDSTR